MFGRTGGWILPALLLLGALLAGCPEGERDFGAKPEARFDATPRTGSVPLLVEFFDESDPGASAIAEWYWDFGDNTTSTERNPRHMYYVAGNYTVSLRVTTALGTSTKNWPGCVNVKDPIIVAEIGPDGGTLEAFDGLITAPAGAVASPVIIGMTAGEGSVGVDLAEQEQVVSPVYTVQHDRRELLTEPGTALEMDLPYYAPMIPEAHRTNEKIYLFAQFPDGLRMPVPGRVDNGRFIANLAGMPRMANYAVVYRPLAVAETLTIDQPWKATTTYQWNTHAWRLSYSPAMLQTLTALRLGNPMALAWYDWRDYPAGTVEDTRQQVLDQLAGIHQTADDIGLISPVLDTTAANEYKLLFYPMGLPADDYDYVDETRYANSLFGSIVIDPEQLVAISKKQARAGADAVQEMEFVHAFSSELFRAIFRGYDYPCYTTPVAPEYGTDRRPVDIAYTLGFADGLGAYLSQIAAEETTVRPAGSDLEEIWKPRSFTPNEQALLSEPLFAPASPRIAAYATATQDFFFYVTNKHAIADPFTYIADSYDGVLEMLRIKSAEADEFNSAILQARLAVDESLQRAFGKTLPEVYFEYACERAYENSTESKIRAADYFLDPFSFNLNRFESDAVIQSAVAGYYPQTFAPSSFPRFQNIPPLSTVAIVLQATPTMTCNLKVAANTYDWMPDTLGYTMRARLYVDGDAYDMTREDSEAIVPDFGATASRRIAVLLLSNVSMEMAYTAEVTVTPREIL